MGGSLKPGLSNLVKNTEKLGCLVSCGGDHFDISKRIVTEQLHMLRQYKVYARPGKMLSSFVQNLTSTSQAFQFR